MRPAEIARSTLASHCAFRILRRERNLRGPGEFRQNE
jgi:hypothetical protein